MDEYEDKVHRLLVQICNSKFLHAVSSSTSHCLSCRKLTIVHTWIIQNHKRDFFSNLQKHSISFSSKQFFFLLMHFTASVLKELSSLLTITVALQKSVFVAVVWYLNLFSGDILLPQYVGMTYTWACVTGKGKHLSHLIFFK